MYVRSLDNLEKLYNVSHVLGFDIRRNKNFTIQCSISVLCRALHVSTKMEKQLRIQADVKIKTTVIKLSVSFSFFSANAMKTLR